MALMTSAPAFSAVRAGVCLVDDHQFGTRAQELISAALALDEIQRNDNEVVDVKERLPDPAVTFQAAGSTRQDYFRVNLKLVAEFRLPLLGKLGRTQDREASDFAAVEQLTGDKTGFHCLADAHIVGNQQAHRVQLESHQQRYELVGPGIDSKAGERTEWARARAEAQANGVAQQPAGSMVADLRRIRKVEACRLDWFGGEGAAGELLPPGT